MLRMSLHYSMLVFAFASLLVQGLLNEAADVGQSRKPQTVEIAPNKSLEAEPNAAVTAAVLSKSSANVSTVAIVQQNITVQSTTQTNAINKTEAANDTSVVGRDNKPDDLAQKQANETQPSITNATIAETTTTEDTTTTTTASTEASASMENTTNPSPTTSNKLTTAASATTNKTIEIAEKSTPPTTTPEEPEHSPIVSEKPDDGMSSGIIALVMAIAFAIVVIIVYAGLLLWRRYLEYRYGNRELLVNDLEFDTNDLRHFEL